MRMKDPIPGFSYVVRQLAERHPTLAFIHLVEPRVNGSVNREPGEGEVSGLHTMRGAELRWNPRLVK